MYNQRQDLLQIQLQQRIQLERQHRIQELKHHLVSQQFQQQLQPSVNSNLLANLNQPSLNQQHLQTLSKNGSVNETLQAILAIKLAKEKQQRALGSQTGIAGSLQATKSVLLQPKVPQPIPPLKIQLNHVGSQKTLNPASYSQQLESLQLLKRQ
mmetsp:Transcript_18656/g.31906  ORF Transcript_18656/g.31906 Transcript_18656/m.31906 type:complete len:154 (-) Transcript_18656:282-743(-)|eukprot:CAMPEP_0168620112 /NCGR_PEP_ID=MMETSP0449_2-20121227/6960_1 /TAXON_ID=1082188 /ORGANISM="Strombidium rassoulzadegani, Strain ras09" /LENGTH=153 /DNA_ID=CAMNT_0008661089 /DNA_START=256 /DNA_END=717 /DNA_ORIENTATION=+